MKKLGAIIGMIICFMLMNIASAYADKETMQSFLKKLDNAERNAINALELYQNTKRLYQSTYAGIKGTLSSVKNVGTAIKNGDISGAVAAGTSAINQGSTLATGEDALSNDQINAATSVANDLNGLSTNPMETLKTQIPSFISNVKDLTQSKKDVEENTVPKNITTENPTAYAKQMEKIYDIMRQNISTMYAKALVMRVEIAKEKAATPPEIDTSNQRILIQNTADVSTRAITRLTRILELEADILEYEAMRGSKEFINKSSEESSETSQDGSSSEDPVLGTPERTTSEKAEEESLKDKVSKKYGKEFGALKESLEKFKNKEDE